MTDFLEAAAAAMSGDETHFNADGNAPIDTIEIPQPRTWGFDVERINESYALVIWGGKAVIVQEQTDGPIEERIRVLSPEALNVWFTESRGTYLNPGS